LSSIPNTAKKKKKKKIGEVSIPAEGTIYNHLKTRWVWQSRAVRGEAKERGGLKDFCIGLTGL
jgi:hypothetical protein